LLIIILPLYWQVSDGTNVIETLNCGGNISGENDPQQEPPHRQPPVNIYRYYINNSQSISNNFVVPDNSSNNS
jgi:hypothetical protein